MNLSHTLRVASWPKTAITVPMHVLFALCSVAPVVLWPMALHGGSVNMTQLHKEAETKEQKLERHYVVAKQDTNKKEKPWYEQVQLSCKYYRWESQFLKIVGENQSMWDENLENISVVKHCIPSNSANTASIHTVLHQAGPRQRLLEKKEVDQMGQEGAAKPVTIKWASPIVFVSKTTKWLKLCVDYRCLNSVTKRETVIFPLKWMSASTRWEEHKC